MPPLPAVTTFRPEVVAPGTAPVPTRTSSARCPRCAPEPPCPFRWLRKVPAVDVAGFLESEPAFDAALIWTHLPGRLADEVRPLLTDEGWTRIEAAASQAAKVTALVLTRTAMRSKERWDVRVALAEDDDVLVSAIKALLRGSR